MPFSSDPPRAHVKAGILSLMKTPECQSSSGHQSRPAGLVMSEASVPAPFKFRMRHECVDWRRINAIDVDRLASELDFQMLQEHIVGVTFCNLQGERCLNCQSQVDPALLKLFRLAQLTIEYLLHSQDCLALTLQAAEEQLQTEAKEKQHLQVQLQTQSQEVRSLKDELKQRKKIIASQQAMITAGLGNYHKCQHCEKTFINISFLRSHMQRRHPMEQDIKPVTDNQKDLQTIKLQEEIIRLQDQLTLAKSEMETQQRNYSTKQENDLTQKQLGLMKQLEIWKETERAHMNCKIDEVKQACQRDMDSMHQKNRDLEKQLLKLQQSSKMRESVQSSPGQATFVQNNEDRQKQELAQLQQKLHNQEIRWTAKLQKIKEEYESEKNQLQTALAQVHSTVSEENKRLERQVEDLELRLEQQQIIKSQNMQIKYFTTHSPRSTVQQDELPAVAVAPEPKTRVVLSEHSSLVCKLDPIVELSEEDKDLSNVLEGPAESQSRQQKVNELMKNHTLKRDMRLAVQQSLLDKLLHLGIDTAVGGLSKTTYECAMAHVLSERQVRQRENAEYRKIQKELGQNLERRIKERNTQPVKKSKELRQVKTLPQTKPQYSTPVAVTQVVSGPPSRQQYAQQPAHQNNSTTHLKISTQMTTQKSLGENSDEEELDNNSSQAQKSNVKRHSTGVQRCTTPPALASFQKPKSSGSHQTPVFSMNKKEVPVLESESDWTDGSEMEEIFLDQLQKNTDQNEHVPKTLCGYVEALNHLEQHRADQGQKKPEWIAIPNKHKEVTNTNDSVQKIKHTGFKDENDDDWDISFQENVPATHKFSSTPMRKSTDKSFDTSTSAWGTFTSIDQEPGLKDTGTGSTLKSSIVTVSDWDDSDGT